MPPHWRTRSRLDDLWDMPWTLPPARPPAVRGGAAGRRPAPVLPGGAIGQRGQVYGRGAGPAGGGVLLAEVARLRTVARVVEHGRHRGGELRGRRVRERHRDTRP